MNGPEFVDDWVVGNNRFEKRCSDESSDPGEEGHTNVPVLPKVTIGILLVAAKREVTESDTDGGGKNGETNERLPGVKIDIGDANCNSRNDGGKGRGCRNANLNGDWEYRCEGGDEKRGGDKECGNQFGVRCGCDGIVQRHENG